jgi:DNA-directed RNA polymerase subunit beta'
MGGEAVLEMLKGVDIHQMCETLRQDMRTATSEAKRKKVVKRLKVCEAFRESGNRPEWMMLTVIPVLPPDLRPLVPLDGGRFATSDLNDLYRRVINRNNRLKRLLELNAPEIIIRNERRMLQEAVDALFDNGRRGKTITGPNKRPLKSLSDMLKGKQGRFRQNLLGKRVDYSGRSVIVVGPQLKLHQCGLPKQMALELFKPFVMKRLVDLNHAQNIKSAKRMVERARPVVWDVLEEVITEHPVLLNRAPTLHRLGIQAFEPQLIEGKAIQIHPLVCSAFNADFDGDQMAVHLPLSAEAQAEARVLMLSTNNILKPSDGRPVTMPTQDMIIGLYFLTLERSGHIGEGRAFSSVSEAMMAFERHEISLQSHVKIRIGGETLDTTLGRAIFNEALPDDYPYVNEQIGKSQLGVIVNDLAERYSKVDVANALDNLKDTGFHWGTRSGVTVSIEDVVTPPRKQEILGGYETQAAKVQTQFDRGLITEDERRQELIEIWTQATAEVSAEMEKGFDEDNPIWMMVHSGARGNMMQVRQIAGMRGLVANPKGEIIPRPIKANFREGLSVVEYFIATHGARKGLADTALRTADSGYLTRRLVDVSQDVIIREEDCGTERGLKQVIATRLDDGRLTAAENVETAAYSRTAATDVTNADGEVLIAAGGELGDVEIARLIAEGVEEIKVRTVLTCEAKAGTCAKCYGRSLATGKLVDIGEAVGTIAAQSIGEPGTQLTMRTFHTGGVAGDDITHGLPRVVELFEARQPKGKAPITESAGRVVIDDSDKTRKLVVTPDDGSDVLEYPVTKRARLLIQDGDHVEVGQMLTHGTPDPQEVLRILGVRRAQEHLVDQVQEVYRSQGVAIHDKHIEIIVRQMLRRVTVIEQGDAQLIPGDLVDRAKFEEENRRVVAEGGTPASGRPVLMGITKASLAVESWLSAASFQETTRVLTDAAIHGKSDSLRGLKENIIIGKLIPAGTGLDRYRNIRVEPTEAARQAAYAVTGYGDYDYGFGDTGTAPVQLDDFDFTSYENS